MYIKGFQEKVQSNKWKSSHQERSQKWKDSTKKESETQRQSMSRQLQPQQNTLSAMSTDATDKETLKFQPIKIRM